MAGTILNRIFSNRRTKDTVAQEEPRFFVPTTSNAPCSPQTDNKESQSRYYDATEQRRPGSAMTESQKGKNFTSVSRGSSHARRASYDSVREQSDIPQSFTKFAPETRSKAAVKLVVDAVSNRNGEEEAFLCQTKRTELRGRRKSNSCSHLLHPSVVDDVVSPVISGEDDAVDIVIQHRQLAPLESLPFEILESIIKMSVVDTSLPENEYVSRYRDVASWLRVSRPIHDVATTVLYRNISISYSIIFGKFMVKMIKEPELAATVKRLDFSRYSNIGFGRTRQASSEIANITPQSLKQCLELTTNLREFLVHQHIDDELDCGVISKLFSMPSTQALDFCASSSSSFVKAFSGYTVALALATSPILQLKRLSLHECATLQSPVFEALLPKLPSLTHLDVAHTLITDKALFSIPHSARLTHLNLGRCTRVTGSGTLRFLTTHPAVKDTLVFLNLMADTSRYRLLDENELTYLLPRLPSTLRSLNIGGAHIDKSHLPLILPLTKYVEELGLSGADLDIDEISDMLSAPGSGQKRAPADSTVPSAVRYIDLSGVASVSQANLHFSSKPLISSKTQPLEVVEVGESVLEQLKKRNKSVKEPEWIVQELGRRGWYVRKPRPDSEIDDGRRSWKMGVRWWGMRKIPMAEMEMVGMYGFYAFKRI